jgi:hypothetical protein
MHGLGEQAQRGGGVLLQQIQDLYVKPVQLHIVLKYRNRIRWESFSTL